MTIRSASSGNGRCSAFASSHGARIHTSRSSGFGSGAYSAKLLVGTKQRLSALSYARQYGDDVLRMLVTGYPPARGGGGMPQRIIVISSSPPELRTTGAG